MTLPDSSLAAALDIPLEKRKAFLNDAITIISHAAKIVQEIRKKGFKTEIKSDSSPVTEADHASEDYILSALRKKYPNIDAIGEEETASGKKIYPRSDTFWLVDPLDGTRGFANGQADYAINIGLIHKTYAVLGAVAIPETGEIFFGSPGLGAFKILNGKKTEIKARYTPPKGLYILSSFYSGKGEIPKEWINNQKISHIEPMGSAEKFVRIAEGKADFYPRLGPTMEWDTAAPQPILEAAGGHLFTPDGKPMRYKKDGWHNPHFYCTGMGPKKS